MTTFSENFSELLFEILVDTNEEKVTQLHNLVKEFKEKNPRSYGNLKRIPFCELILEIIEEAHGYVNQTNESLSGIS